MHAALTTWAVLVYIFLFAPILLLVAFSFNANRYGTFPFTGWTTHWYSEVFGNYQIKDALTTTLKVAAEVTVVSTIVGTAAAFPLVRSRLPFRGGVRVAFTLPIMIPGLLIGVSLLVLLTSVFHLQLSAQTAVIGQASTRRRSSCSSSPRACRASMPRSSGRPAISARTRSTGCAMSSCR